MARPLRIQFEGAWYHVMNRGINHAMLFFNNGHRHAFLNFLNDTKKIYGIEVHAYCLMDNHYHLIIHTPRGNLSDAMKYLNSSFAMFVNTTIRRDGPLFKGRYKAILIGADDYLIRLSRYIHLNPIKANMVDIAIAYRWSSYPAYLGCVKPAECLTTDEIIRRFGKTSFRTAYKQYVEIESDLEIEKFYNHTRWHPVLGSGDFKKSIDRYIKNHSLSSEIVGTNRILTPPSIEFIIKAVSSHFAVPPNKITNSSRPFKNPARQLAIYLCREYGHPLAKIANIMGEISYKSVSAAICRVKNNPSQIQLAVEIRGRISTIYGLDYIGGKAEDCRDATPSM